MKTEIKKAFDVWAHSREFRVIFSTADSNVGTARLICNGGKYSIEIGTELIQAQKDINEKYGLNRTHGYGYPLLEKSEKETLQFFTNASA